MEDRQLAITTGLPRRVSWMCAIALATLLGPFGRFVQTADPAPVVTATAEMDTVLLPGVFLWPTVAAGEHQFFVAGNLVEISAGVRDTVPYLLAMDETGRTIGAPAGDFLFAFPKCVLDVSGGLHVFWAEPEVGNRPATATDWLDLGGLRAPLTTVWHARFDRNAGWSSAVRLYRGQELQWRETQGGVAVADDGRLHVAFGDRRGVDSMGTIIPEGLVHLVYDSVWHETRVHQYGSLYTSPAATGDTFYVASIRSSGPDNPNSVFILKTSDAGGRWPRPHVVSYSHGQRAADLQAFSGRRGVLDLVWAVSTRGGVLSDIVRHVRSADSGQTWSDPADLSLADGASVLQAARDSHGRIHAVFREGWSAARPGAGVSRVGYARWDEDNGWVRPGTLDGVFPTGSISGVAISITERGSPVVVVVRHPGSPGPSRRALLYILRS
jgi:hypothetical protein